VQPVFFTHEKYFRWKIDLTGWSGVMCSYWAHFEITNTNHASA